MPLNIPNLLTWARILLIPLVVGVYYLPLTVAEQNFVATAAFLVGRYLARDMVVRKLQGSDRFRAVDSALKSGGWWIVLLLRLSPVFPFNLLNYAYGLTPQVMVPLSKRLTVSTSLVLQKKYYFTGGGLRNGPVWSATAGAKYYYSQDGFVQASYRHAVEGTKAAYLDNVLNGLNAGWYSALPGGFALYAGPGVSYTRYAAAEAAYSKRREDTQYSAVFNLSKEFPAAGLSATMGCTFTRNDSNLGLYDYVRRQMTAQVSMAF